MVAMLLQRQLPNRTLSVIELLVTLCIFMAWRLSGYAFGNPDLMHPRFITTNPLTSALYKEHSLLDLSVNIVVLNCFYYF